MLKNYCVATLAQRNISFNFSAQLVFPKAVLHINFCLDWDTVTD